MAATSSSISSACINGMEYAPLDLKRGDISFALKSFSPEPNLHATGLSPQDIKKRVKESPRLRTMINEISFENEVTEESVLKVVDDIVDEIGHNMTLPAVRTVAMSIRGTLRRILRGIYIDKEGLEELQSAVLKYPVVILPSHRSYLDFILVSYFLLEFNIQLPAIAAGQDFMHMKFVSSLLRGSGAFFLRRTFGSDKLYKLIFTIYMQTVLTNMNNPIEFFIEGTRSRTAKSLHPKLGLLSMIVEPYLHGVISDILLFPLSISYERTLEESLFARELLGIPKPKESTTGLFKARSFLSSDYGSIFVNFSKPISLHQFCVSKGISRIPHGVQPRDAFSFVTGEREMISSLGYHILDNTNKRMKLFPSSLLSSIILHYKNDGIERDELIYWMELLKTELENRGALVHWNNDDSSVSIDDAVKLLTSTECIRMRSGKVELVRRDKGGGEGEGRVKYYRLEDLKGLQLSTPQYNAILDNGYNELLLGHYRNQILHWFIPDSLVLSCIIGTTDIELDCLKRRYLLLSNALSREFILPQKPIETVLEDSLHSLIDRELVETKGSLVFMSSFERQEKIATFLSNLVKPFITAVWVMCLYLESLMGGVQTVKLTLRNTQQLAAKLINDGIIKTHEVLSLDIYKNTISSFNVGGILFEPELEFEGRDRLVKVSNSSKLRQLTIELGNILFNESPPISINDVSKL